ncbi:unnamed protein product [Echinostoma caproni]|uniref:Protein shisa-5 n=1 Tax=Echinostoma caproni TaxID=27848 RepID=A0A183A9V9_9TREM|nr:unnamed protein product [Echinostoma caproni]
MPREISTHDYTVCEGPKREYVDTLGEYQTYPYFLCPDDPNQMFERYCCRTITGEGVCCSYDELRKWAILGGCIAIVGILVMVALVVYCCCFAKKRAKPATQPSQTTQLPKPVKPATEPNVPQPIGFIPYPVGPSPPTIGPVPMYGVPAPYPVAAQPGSAWATVAPLPGSSWQQPNYQQEPPPPPYPGDEATSGGKTARPYPT